MHREGLDRILLRALAIVRAGVVEHDIGGLHEPLHDGRVEDIPDDPIAGHAALVQALRRAVDEQPGVTLCTDVPREGAPDEPARPRDAVHTPLAGDEQRLVALWFGCFVAGAAAPLAGLDREGEGRLLGVDEREPVTDGLDVFPVHDAARMVDVGEGIERMAQWGPGWHSGSRLLQRERVLSRVIHGRPRCRGHRRSQGRHFDRGCRGPVGAADDVRDTGQVP